MRKLTGNAAILAAAIVVSATNAVADYSRVEWIKGSGNAWIYTGYTPAATDRIEIKFKLEDLSGNQFLFCSRGTSTTANMFCGSWLGASGAKLRIDYGNDSTGQSIIETAPNTTDVYIMTLDGNNMTGKVETEDGTTTLGTVSWTMPPTIASAISLFASHTSGANLSASSTAVSNYGKFTMYWCKVYNSAGVMVRCWVPAVDNSAEEGTVGHFGVFDLCNDVFWPCKGSVPFTAGAKTLPGRGVNRTLAMTDIALAEGGLSVNLAFARNGYPQRLFAVYGATDCGATTNGWDHVVPLAEVGTEETSRNVFFATGGVPARYLRYVSQAAIPGAQPIEYLESSGTDEYIDTGFCPNGNARADLSLRVMKRPSSYNDPFGTRKANTFQMHAIGNAGQNLWDCRWNNCAGISISKTIVGEHFFSYNCNNYTFDGTKKSFASSANFPSRTDYPCYVFAVNNTGVATFFADMRLYSLDIWDEGEMVRSYTPCVKDDGTLAIYDAVNGTFTQQAAGTTPLTAGDIAWSATEAIDMVTPFGAYWRTDAIDEDAGNPQNWVCSNLLGTAVSALPTRDIAAHVSGSVCIQIPSNTSFVCSRLVLDNAALTGDCDWRGLGADTQIEGLLDLNGNSLTVAGLAGSGSIICSSAQTGVLCIDSDSDSSNGGVDVAGNVRIVKDGIGAFTQSKAYLSYWGGTEVKGGTLTRGATHGAFGGVNLIRNGTFDDSAISANYVYTTDPDWFDCPNWTCNGSNVGRTKAVSGALIVANSGYNVGTSAAFLKSGKEGSTDLGDSWFAQKINIARAGVYRLGFTYIAAGASERRGAAVQVNLIHGGVTTQLTSFTANATTYSEFDIPRITLSEPGEYTLQFHQNGGSKVYLTGFDDIVLEHISDVNLIRNGSFDEGTISGNYQIASASDWPENPYWTCGPLDGRSDCGVGLTKADGGWVASGVPLGKYAAYLRTNSGCRYAHMEQTFNVAEPGFYKVAFSCIAYNSAVRQGEPVQVRLIHGGATNVVCTVTANNTGRKYRSAVAEAPEAGEYTLQFYQELSTVENVTGSTAKATSIDDVEFSRIPDVTVCDGARLDMSEPSSSVTPCYPMILDGGTLHRPGIAYFKNMLFTDDSEISVTGNNNIGAGGSVLDLGGNTLTATIASSVFFRICNCEIKNGTIESNGGTLRLGADSGFITATNVNIVANSAIYPFNDVDLANYTANYGGTSNSGTAAVNVHGTFTPSSHDYYYGCTMQDGSTIDFTSRTNELGRVKTLNETSAFTAGKNKIDFADGATVSIRLGELRAPSGGQLIAWASKPENVTFKPAEGERPYILVEKDDGLYFTSGFMIIVK